MRPLYRTKSLCLIYPEDGEYNVHPNVIRTSVHNAGDPLKLTYIVYILWKTNGKGARIALYSYGIQAGGPSNCSSVLGRVKIVFPSPQDLD